MWRSEETQMKQENKLFRFTTSEVPLPAPTPALFSEVSEDREPLPKDINSC